MFDPEKEQKEAEAEALNGKREKTEKDKQKYTFGKFLNCVLDKAYDLEIEQKEAEAEALNGKRNETSREKTEKDKQKYTFGKILNCVLDKAYDLEIEQKEAEVEALNGNGNKTGREKKDKDKQKYNLGICVFGVLNVLLISIIGITAFYVSSDKNFIVVHNADICVPCEDLRLHPDDIIEGIERRGENKMICCVPEERGPDALIGNFIDHWLKKKLATDKDRQFVRYKCGDIDITETQKPIIKLLGKHVKQTADHHKLHWDGDHEMAIVPDDGSIIHHKEHGFIEIKRTGLYYLYNQVVLDHDGNGHNYTHAPDIYIHKVIQIEAETSHHKSPSEKVLIKTANSHCESKMNRQTITSYLGGAFELSEGDKLAVVVNNKTEVVPVPHMNFFGAYML